MASDDCEQLDQQSDSHQRDRIDQMRQRIEELNNENAKLKTDSSAQVIEYDDKIFILQNELDFAKDSEKEQRRRAEKAERQTQNDKAQLRYCFDSIELLTVQMEERTERYMTEINRLTEDLDKERHINYLLKSGNEELQAQLSASEKLCQQQEDFGAELKNDYTELLKKYEKLQEDIKVQENTLTAEIVKLKKELLWKSQEDSKIIHEELNKKDYKEKQTKAMTTSTDENKKPISSEHVPKTVDDKQVKQLAEEMSQLYDDLWTDAAEGLDEKGLGEEEFVKLLLELLTIAYNACEVVQNQSPQEDSTACSGKSEPTESFLKETSLKMKQLLGLEYKILDVCQPYIKRCVEICWMMQIQEPPVCIDCKVPDDMNFDSSLYKAYTRRGNKVQFIVWPVIYSYKGGPVVMKGVAQGRD